MVNEYHPQLMVRKNHPGSWCLQPAEPQDGACPIVHGHLQSLPNGFFRFLYTPISIPAGVVENRFFIFWLPFFSLWDLLQKRRTERLRMASNIASCRRWSVVCQHVCRSAKTTCTDVAASSCSLPLPINCNAISGNLHRLPHACTVAVRNAAPPESDNFCSKLFPSL